MATEDLTTYIEVDPGNALTKTATKVTAAYIANNESDYLYKDFGANFFDAIDLLFSFRISTTSTTNGYGEMGFSNSVDDVAGWAGPFIELYLYKRGDGDYRAVFGVDWAGIDSNTIYYCQLIRVAGSDSVTVDIYEDAARTVLYATLTQTGLGTTKWRYFYPISSYSGGNSSEQFYGYYQNFDFQRKSAGQVRFIGMGL